MITFGVCGSKGCRKSFENVKKLDYFVDLLMPPEEPGGGVGRPPMLDPDLKGIFQVVTADSLYCASCGGKLLNEAALPSLGKCSKCQRTYNKADLDSSCCPKCGERVAISDTTREEYRRQQVVNRILGRVPLLQEYGLLPS